MTEPAFVAHYLGETQDRALCGAANPVLDLGPVNGEIDCVACRLLWDAGFSLVRRPPTWRRLGARLRAVAAPFQDNDGRQEANDG